MGACAGVCHLEHTQLSQETKKWTGRLMENVREKSMLAGNGIPKKVPNATQLVGSRPLKGAVGHSQPCPEASSPHGNMPLQQRLTHCVGRGSGRRWRVVGTMEEWRSLPLLMDWTPFPAPCVRAVGLGCLSPLLNFDPAGQIQQSLRETWESQS